MKNDFAETPSVVDNSELKKEDFDGDALSDLKALKKSIDDGYITSEEANVIAESMGKIEEEAKEGLKEIIKKIFLQEGFSALDKTTYDGFKALSEKTIYMIPTRDEIIQLLIDNTYNLSGISLHKNDPIINKLDRDDFHGIIIKGDTIEVKYDGYGINDTFQIKFNPLNGKILTSEWINGKYENVDVTGKTKVDLDSMDDNISELEQKIQRETDLEIQRLRDKGQDENVNELQEKTEQSINEIKEILDLFKKKININIEDIKNLGENTRKVLEEIKDILKKYGIEINNNKEGILELGNNTKKILDDIEKVFKKYGVKINTIKKQVDTNSTGVADNKADIEKFHKDEIEEEKISPENMKKYEYAHDWYKSHGGLKNSYQIKDIKYYFINNNDFGDYKTSKVDGKFNVEFFNDVIKYQEKNDLKVDGLVGEETFEDMLKEYKGNHLDTRKEAREYYNIEKYNKTEKWYKNSSLESIKNLQNALNKEGFGDDGFVEGKFNYELMQKIIEFQVSNSENLKGDGKAGYNTLKSLGLVSNRTEAKRFYK